MDLAFRGRARSGRRVHCGALPRSVRRRRGCARTLALLHRVHRAAVRAPRSEGMERGRRGDPRIAERHRRPYPRRWLHWPARTRANWIARARGDRAWHSLLFGLPAHVGKSTLARGLAERGNLAIRSTWCERNSPRRHPDAPGAGSDIYTPEWTERNSTRSASTVPKPTHGSCRAGGRGRELLPRRGTPHRVAFLDVSHATRRAGGAPVVAGVHPEIAKAVSPEAPERRLDATVEVYVYRRWAKCWQEIGTLYAGSAWCVKHEMRTARRRKHWAEMMRWAEALGR